MANTEWWQRGPFEGVPAALQPVAHILLQVHETVADAFHVRHITGVVDRLFTYLMKPPPAPSRMGIP